jgi:hypothetical protein
MSYLSKVKMSSFGLKIDRLAGLYKVEENPNAQRIINHEPAGDRAY